MLSLSNTCYCANNGFSQGGEGLEKLGGTTITAPAVLERE